VLLAHPHPAFGGGGEASRRVFHRSQPALKI